MRTATWERIGTDVTKCNNMEQVLKTSGLDYTVEKEPVFLDIKKGIIVPNRFATVNSQGKIYDVVSDKFEVIQNQDAFDFVNYMGADLEFVKAGETAGGMVYIIAKLPEVDILGDAFTPYVIFRNGFSGKYKITAAICPLRIVCQNQFNAAFQEAENTVTIRHVGNANAKLEEAREVLKKSADFMEVLRKRAIMMAGAKFSPRVLDNVLDRLFPIDGLDEMNAFKRNRLITAREAFQQAYNHDDNQNFKGTAWGIVNAYTDFITHQAPSGQVHTRDEGKFMKVTFGKPSVNHILDVIKQVAG
jgi:phage/plasmid-like protein (TIGR03299 family)